jgi:hypothetical protein
MVMVDRLRVYISSTPRPDLPNLSTRCTHLPKTITHHQDMADTKLDQHGTPANMASQKDMDASELAMEKKDTGSDDVEHPAIEEEEFVGIDEKKVLRKMDLRLIPMLTILYLLCFLDRGNIGNAKIEGMTEDLSLEGSDYNIACSLPEYPLFGRH